MLVDRGDRGRTSIMHCSVKPEYAMNSIMHQILNFHMSVLLKLIFIRT
jgi:hypothetical protein